MDIRVTSTVVEIVANDLQRSLDFYRLLGLAVPEPEGPHVEVGLPGGSKLAFDTEDVIAGMHPGWTPPTSAGRVALAFGLDSAVRRRRDVRAAHRSGPSRNAEAVRRAVGSALRDGRRPGRHLRRPVRTAGQSDATLPAVARPGRAPHGAGAAGPHSLRGPRPLHTGFRRAAVAPLGEIAGFAAASPGRNRRRRRTGAAGCGWTIRSAAPPR